MKVASKAKPKGTIRVKVKKGDLVVFIAGKDYNRYDSTGKRTPHRGRVIQVDPRTGKVKVEGAGIVKKHTRPNPQAANETAQKGGIIEKEAWIDISNVALVDPISGEPTRVKYQTGEDGKKQRIAIKSGKVIE